MLASFLANDKAIFASLALLLSFAAFIPYLRSILAGITRPHLFSWLIWSISMVIAFAAQLSDGAHLGAYHTGFSSLICLFVCFMALKNGEKDITRSDYISLAIALLAIPVWLVTAQPLFAVLIVLAIDLSGFYPTIRKSITKPHQENATAYFFSAVSFFAAILALGNYSLTTMIYPATIMMVNLIFPIFLLLQRRKHAHQAA